MSLRTVKTFLKRTNAADKKARETIDNRNLDALDLGIPSEQSMLHEYALADLAYARWCYTKMKRAFKSLTKRQQRKLIAKNKR